ncbi:hypothetical protein SH580_03290 [Coraliomargarita algicola]|uniref:Beta-galactosidase n=1 Tax=Coraliomargarita algicola TaxID=3092156 RepID=A0ABZ0RNQ1_9BACT|nr:hypothetical protein [Coraliomargarita sp. J2-16]WPJ96728.1 hypothetical protein SH580_03290 [Coraliomargarita sp. J2-16]
MSSFLEKLLTAKIQRSSIVRCSSLLFAGLMSLAQTACLEENQKSALDLSARNFSEAAVVDTQSLRGYGNVSARQWVDGQGRVVEIICEDEAKAELTHAKYLSDLQTLPGLLAVDWEIEDVAVSGYQLADLLTVSALREGNRLYVFSAPDASTMRHLLTQAFGSDLGRYASSSNAKVPMWLDRWDQHGFQFYYRPWTTPEGVDLKDYDITKEFDYMAEQEVGVALWSSMMELDSADGQLNEGWWDWSRAWAKEKNVATSIHPSLATMGMTNWAMDRWREDTVQKMPQFLGTVKAVGDPFRGAIGVLAWGDNAGRRGLLSILQDAVAKYANDENLVAWMEPHLELAHAGHDYFLEYGPAADRTYRAFLQEKYASDLNAVNASWLKEFASWEDIHVPEVASFAGWGKDAIDLTGTWKVKFPGKDQAVESDWVQVDYDDSDWAGIEAPGTDRNLFLPTKELAVYRRDFEVPQAWLEANEKSWLYLWDMSYSSKLDVAAHVNGQEVLREGLANGVPHRAVIPMEGLLQAGTNQISLELPSGYLGYRVYLSSTPPANYPELGESLNAQWADFWEWRQWTRTESVRMGLEMIREEDPNRHIAIMHPDDFVDHLKGVMEPMGASFHNTGYMSAFFSQFLPALSRSSRLPFSLEPGSPAYNLTKFKQLIGRWHTEGVQGIDYFIHVGAVMWHDDIRAEFERDAPLIQLFGQYHSEPADVALLHSSNIPLYWRGPWTLDPNVNLSTGYWSANSMVGLIEHYDHDAITDGDFDRGHAARYKMIIDANTSVMSPDMLEDIEAYVRAGGTFVTFGHTGRHSLREPNVWSISELTGYEVIATEKYDDEGKITQDSWQNVQLAAGQTVFEQGEWLERTANGLHLKPVADDVQNLVMWEDGSVAVGLRPLGKGKIIHVGTKWHGAKLNDRISTPLAQSTSQIRAMSAFISNLLEHEGVRSIAAQLQQTDDSNVFMRQFVSNNGLYDVWTMWNRSEDHAAEVQLQFADGEAPSYVIDLMTGEKLALEGAVVPNLKFNPLETRAYLTPRKDLVDAPLAWFDLQCHWWRGGGADTGVDFKTPEFPNTLAMGEDWAWRAVEGTEMPAEWSTKSFDDSDWEKMGLRVWNTPAHADVKHAVYRKQFTVPADWTAGRIELWLHSWYRTTFVDEARIWLDGELIHDWSNRGLRGELFPEVLQAGTTHTLVIEGRGEGTLNGVRGNAWLTYVPDAETTIDLAGQWIPSADVLRDQAPVELPGAYTNALNLRREVFIPKDLEGKQVMFSMDAQTGMIGVIINGNWVRRHHHNIGEAWDINLTPWIRFGENNTIEISTMKSAGNGDVKSIELKFYQAEVYP